MNFLDAALFLVLAAIVAAGCWRQSARAADRIGAATLLFAAFWGITGTAIWLVGQIQLSAISCAAIFAILIGALWLLPAPKAAAESGRIRPYFGRLDGALCFYIAGVCALMLFLALAPPTASDYDSLVYHLAAPAQYLHAGRIVELPYDHHSYFPLTLEMLYAAGLSWRGAIFAKLFHWLMLPTGAALLFALARRHLSRRAGFLGAALWVSLPVVQSEAATAYIDLGLAVFTLGAVFCFLNWRQHANARWLLACGVFCGLCLGSKYLGALVCIWLAGWIVAVTLREKRELRPVLGAATLALLVGGGWYFRNVLWTGNPVFPFAYGVFGGRGWTAEMAAAYARDQAGFGFGRSALDYFQLPFRLAFTPLNARLVDGKPLLFETGGMAFSSILGPALLAFGAPLLALRNKPRAASFVLWTIGFLFLFWALTGQYLRYLLPAYALACLACGWALEKYLKRGAILRWTSALCLAAWLAFTPALTASNASGNYAVITGSQPSEEYLTRTFAGYDAMRWASVNTPATARFAVWGEPRCFYLNRDYFWADKGHNTLVNETQPLLPQLKKLGATHVLVNEEAARNGGFGAPPAAWNEVVASGAAHEIYASRGYRVYQLDLLQMSRSKPMNEPEA